jgi:hypothetical protein
MQDKITEMLRSNFETDWLFVYQDKNYKTFWDQFRKIGNLKQVVREELNNNFTKELAEIYHKYLNINS